MKLNENIYHYRTQLEMSQGDLAEALEVSRQSVSKWETGSSVPELEKLVKMSALFGVTLDALVGSEPIPIPKPESSPLPSVPDLPVAVPAPFPTKKVLGTVLLCFGALALILGLVLDHRNSEIVALAGGIGALCGLFCLCLTDPAIYCGWSLWAGYLLWLFVLTPRWEDEGLLIALAGVLLLSLLIWTVSAHMSGRTRLPLWLRCVGSVILVLLLILLLINLVPLDRAYVTAPTPVSPS